MHTEAWSCTRAVGWRAIEVFFVVQDVSLLSPIEQRRALGSERTTSRLQVDKRRQIENLRLLRHRILGWSHAASECETPETRW